MDVCKEAALAYTLFFISIQTLFAILLMIIDKKTSETELKTATPCRISDMILGWLCYRVSYTVGLSKHILLNFEMS